MRRRPILRHANVLGRRARVFGRKRIPLNGWVSRVTTKGPGCRRLHGPAVIRQDMASSRHGKGVGRVFRLKKHFERAGKFGLLVHFGEARLDGCEYYETTKLGRGGNVCVELPRRENLFV